MPYPMMEWPRFGNFRRQLETEFGCRYIDDGKVTVNGDRVARLERDIDGETRRYAVYYSDEERLAPTVVRSICAHLRVDPTKFGLTLG